MHQGAKASWSLEVQGTLKARAFLCKAYITNVFFSNIIKFNIVYSIL